MTIQATIIITASTSLIGAPEFVVGGENLPFSPVHFDDVSTARIYAEGIALGLRLADAPPVKWRLDMPDDVAISEFDGVGAAAMEAARPPEDKAQEARVHAKVFEEN